MFENIRRDFMDNYLIYPKQFRRVNIPVEKNRCFMIMPFKKDLDYVYGTIKKGLTENGYICNRVDEIPGSTPIINKVLSEILKSRYIIADLTDCNPNVFYELGVAHSFKDADNIIILKQKNSKVPFDITHLTYIEYEENNPRYLISSILNCINNCSTFADFQEILNIKGIIPYVKENNDYFIDYLHTEFKTHINELTDILSNENTNICEDKAENLICQYENIVRKAIISKESSIVDGIMKIYFELLGSCSSTVSAQTHTLNFLDNSFFSNFCVDYNKIRIWQTDLAIMLAKYGKCIPQVLPWIIQYFTESKTATIDLNRYKLEAFLMTSEHPTVNEVICNSVFDKNCYIREHMSDIIGEKKLTEAVDNLCAQLIAEKNFYSAVSEIEALGKLGNDKAIYYIIQWITNNEQNIISEQQFFVLKHARIALVKLEKSFGCVIKEFDEKYSCWLKDCFIL